MILNQLPKHITTPSILLESKDFIVKLAENSEEVELVQRLRYKIFNLEQGKGLKISEECGIDTDEYDKYCLHLMVIDKSTNDIIGTYRAHIGYIALESKGFYSSREFDIQGLDTIAAKCIELGRSCVSPEYRNGRVVSLLWTAISILMMRTDLIYMLGCVSLEETDPIVGWAIYEYIREQYSAPKNVTTTPKPGYQLERPSDDEINGILNDPLIENYIPPLFKGYLRLGAVICGEPALDKEFGTIDYFILVNIRKVPERYLKYFNYTQPKH